MADLIRPVRLHHHSLAFADGRVFGWIIVGEKQHYQEIQSHVGGFPQASHADIRTSSSCRHLLSYQALMISAFEIIFGLGKNLKEFELLSSLRR